ELTQGQQVGDDASITARIGKLHVGEGERGRASIEIDHSCPEVAPTVGQRRRAARDDAKCDRVANHGGDGFGFFDKEWHCANLLELGGELEVEAQVGTGQVGLVNLNGKDVCAAHQQAGADGQAGKKGVFIGPGHNGGSKRVVAHRARGHVTAENLSAVEIDH